MGRLIEETYSYCSISGEPCRHHSNDQVLYIKACSDIHSKKLMFKKIWSDAVEFCNNASKPVADLKGYCPAKMAMSKKHYVVKNDKVPNRSSEHTKHPRLRKANR